MTPSPFNSGFYAQCHAHVQRQPERVAISSAGRTLSYSEVVTRIERGAAFLVHHGIDAQATVGLMIVDEVEHLLASLSLFAVGATQFALASHDPLASHQDLAARAGVTHFLIGEHDMPQPISPGANVVHWSSEATATVSDTQVPPAQYPAGTILLRTSGTTGKPNLMAYSETQLGLQAARHPEYSNERLLRLAAIEHNNSKRHRLYCVWQGGTNVFIDRLHRDLRSFIDEQQVSCLDISRMHAASMVQTGALGYIPHLKLRTGGSAIPHALRLRMRDQITPQLFVRYASSETGAIAMAGPDSHDEEGVAGQILPSVILEIVDNADQALPSGQTGIIRIQAPGMITGYVDQPEQSAARFRDGWFYPGDLGCIRTDGQLVVQGRRDEMIIMNGLNIFPEEIEAVLEAHPDVLQAAALALPSRNHGQLPVAAVELRPGASLEAEALRKWAQPQLGIRSPKRIITLAALPRNGQGKITKRLLVEQFQQRSPADTTNGS